MSKKVLGRSLNEVLARAKPTRLIDVGGASTANAPAVAQGAGQGPVPASRPVPVPAPAPVLSSAPTPSPAAASAPVSVPVSVPGPASSAPTVPAPAAPITVRPTPSPTSSYGSTASEDSPARFQGQGGHGSSLPLRPIQSPATVAGPRPIALTWLLCLILDVILLAIACWLVFGTPLARGWSYGLAAACIVLGACVACLLPFVHRSTLSRSESRRSRPERPRVHVTLTRL